MLIAALRSTGLRLPKLEVRQWSASLVLAAVFALNLLAGISILGIGTPADRASAKVSAGLPAAFRNQVPPAPEPLKFREIAPEDAVSINAAVPISTLPNPAAHPRHRMPHLRNLL
jgi:hypothetical protein